MWKTVTIIIALCIQKIYSNVIPEMACYRLDHQPPDLTSEIQTSITPKTFLNMVEEFTKMEDIVLLKAGEKIITNQSLTTFEYSKLGIFRKSTLFYIAVAVCYLYWLIYTFCTFKFSRSQFDLLIAPYRGFYLKSVLMLFYFLFIALTSYYAFDTFSWIQHYVNVYDDRSKRMEKFMNEYTRTVDLVSSRLACYIEEIDSELDEVEVLHNKIKRYHLQNVPPPQYILNTVKRFFDHFKQDCNATVGVCGFGTHKVKISNWSIADFFLTESNIPDPTVFRYWNDFPVALDKIKTNVLVHGRSDVALIKQAAQERLILLKDVYASIENLFTLPSPYIVSTSFYILLCLFAPSCFISLLALLAIYRGHDYLEKNNAAVPLGSFLTLCNHIFQLAAIWALIWSFIVILFSSASHSLFLNVLRDTDLEVIGKLNVTDSNGTSFFNLRDFLKSTDETVLEELLALNPQELLKNNDETYVRVLNSIDAMKDQLKLTVDYHTPIKELCDNLEVLFLENTKGWIAKINCEEIEKIVNLCVVGKVECFYCGFERDRIQASIAASKIRELSLTVANRTGNDLEDFKYLHEKYRLQMWNYFVAPITFLEVPCIILLISIYVLSFMLMASISIVETKDPDDSSLDRYQYYQFHTADRGLYWFNI
ncbi:Chloride channel CLIC-like protein 1 [Caenorhabditis elegans]|uniref:Chloride channel CLIC-like protein 1 n=1 Tax=Caenorhabditis elegans TaxID=6239 RepID=O17037_CAEEL|nr:Chloride channel CLIC-like protein 1 [Caenorhabditis elegans]CCD68166.1 Chloride channel CLIC-like protein 1 [Caenorhabditis elegans]|eukprot:NP_504737.2 Uncharacterized protein CELE_T15B7.14 [Caenorhabditis elegans]